MGFLPLLTPSSISPLRIRAQEFQPPPLGLLPDVEGPKGSAAGVGPTLKYTHPPTHPTPRESSGRDTGTLQPTKRLLLGPRDRPQHTEDETEAQKGQ